MTGVALNARTLRSDIIFAFGLALACLVALQIRDVLMLLYVSALFAVVLSPIVQKVSEVHVRGWRPFKGSAILFLLVMAAAFMVAFGFLALPPVIKDMQQFGREMPQRLPAVIDKLKALPFADQLNTDDLTAKAQDFASRAVTYVLLSIRDWAAGFANFAMGLILTIYFMLEGNETYRWFLSFFPLESRDRLDKTLRRAELRMGKWLFAQGALMILLGLCSTTVYMALNVRYAYALGVLTGLMNIIPVLGAAICIALALLVAALDSWGRVLGIAIFYLVYLQVENSYLTPRIMKNSVDLPGLAILVALLLGAGLGGVVGAMVSVPTAVLVSVLVDEYLVRKDPVNVPAVEPSS
jgi:predicted PurR-regulated permease PerM